MTVLLVAHDVNPLLPYLDRVVYFGAARAVVGSPREVISAATLTRLYGVPIEVLEASDGRMVVVGLPEPPAHHHDRHAISLAAGLSLNLVSDYRQLTEFPFMVNALEAGTLVAVMAGVDGLVHGPAPPELRRPHDVRAGVPGRHRRAAGRAPGAGRILRLLHWAAGVIGSVGGAGGAVSRSGEAAVTGVCWRSAWRAGFSS